MERIFPSVVSAGLLAGDCLKRPAGFSKTFNSAGTEKESSPQPSCDFGKSLRNAEEEVLISRDFISFVVPSQKQGV